MEPRMVLAFQLPMATSMTIRILVHRGMDGLILRLNVNAVTLHDDEEEEKNYDNFVDPTATSKILV